MDSQLAQKLIALNAAFYEQHAASFANTRQSAWAGWERVLSALGLEDADAAESGNHRDSMGSKQTHQSESVSVMDAPESKRLAVLDVACGNMRFAEFLAKSLPDTRIDYLGVDSCVPLASASRQLDLAGLTSCAFVECDVLARLYGENSLFEGGRGETFDSVSDAFELRIASGEERDSFDLVACFGFLHHVPGFEARVRLLRGLLQAARPGGAVAVSLWRFMDSESLAERARIAHEKAIEQMGEDLLAGLERNDYLLGWQNEPGAVRYCHHFDDVEIQQLVDAISPWTSSVDSFLSDGRTGALNSYLLLRP